MLSVYKNQPIINFDNFVDVESLLNLRPHISAFISKNHHLLKPTKYASDNFLDTSSIGIVTLQEEFKKHPENIQDPALREKLTDLVNCDKFGHYALFEQNALASSHSLNVRYAPRYREKHLGNSCVPMPEDSEFTFFYNWLSQQNLFSDFGRVIIFVNYPGSETPTHKDYPNIKDYSNDQFVLINFFKGDKNFYVYDADTDSKLYLPGHCNWFNTGEFHGCDPVARACYTIRIDGVFTDEILAKV